MNVMRTIGVAIVGCGYIAELHAEAFAQAGSSQLISVFDTDPARAEVFASRHGGTATKSLESIFGGDAIDLVMVCTPHDSHISIIRSLLDSPARIFCEKPLSLTLSESKQVASSGDRIALGFNMRFSVGMTQLRHSLSQIAPQMMDISILAPHFLDGWGGRPKIGGGVLPGLASHAFDLIRYLLGSELAWVQAITARQRTTGNRLADHAVIVCRTLSGTQLSIVVHDGANDAYAMAKGRLLLVRAMSSLGVHEATLDSCNLNRAANSIAVPPSRAQRLGYMEQAVELVAWARDGSPQRRLASFDDGVAVAAAVDAARDSSIDGGLLTRLERSHSLPAASSP